MEVFGIANFAVAATFVRIIFCSPLAVFVLDYGKAFSLQGLMIRVTVAACLSV